MRRNATATHLRVYSNAFLPSLLCSTRNSSPTPNFVGNNAGSSSVPTARVTRDAASNLPSSAEEQASEADSLLAWLLHRVPHTFSCSQRVSSHHSEDSHDTETPAQ